MSRWDTSGSGAGSAKIRWIQALAAELSGTLNVGVAGGIVGAAVGLVLVLGLAFRESWLLRGGITPDRVGKRPHSSSEEAAWPLVES